MRAPVLLATILITTLVDPSTAEDVRVSFRSQPPGMTLVLDGVATTTPFDRLLPDGSEHTLAAVSPQDIAAGSRYAFAYWDGFANAYPTPSITFRVSAGTPLPHLHTAVYHTQYAVTLSQIPGGSIVPGPGTTWHDAGASFDIQVIPAAGYSFGEWVGDGDGSYTGGDPRRRLVIRTPIHEHASFAIDTITTTVTTMPSGLTVAIDGVLQATPFTMIQQANVGILLEAPATQDIGGGKAVFLDWSDGGARAHMVAPSRNTTFVVRYAPAPGHSWMTSAWPNPSRDVTRFLLALDVEGPASLVVHDLSGRIVRHLVEGPMPAGLRPVPWDGRDDHGQPVPSGIYFARAHWAGFDGEERIVRLR